MIRRLSKFFKNEIWRYTWLRVGLKSVNFILDWEKVWASGNTVRLSLFWQILYFWSKGTPFARPCFGQERFGFSQERTKKWLKNSIGPEKKKRQSFLKMICVGWKKEKRANIGKNNHFWEWLVFHIEKCQKTIISENDWVSFGFRGLVLVTSVLCKYFIQLEPSGMAHRICM